GKVAAAVEGLKWVAVFAMLTGCGHKSTEVRIAVQPPSTNNYPTHLAQWLGFYQQEGVNVSISQIAGASKVLEAVVGGSADVGGGVYEQTIQMAAEGREIVSFVSLLRSPNFAILGRSSELKGKAVGVSSPGSPSQFYANHFALAQGLAPGDVSYVGIGMGATALAALQNKQVDAAVLFGSAITEASSRGEFMILADSRTPEGLRKIFGVDDYPASCLLARGEWLRANPDSARRVARALLRSLAWIREHSAEEILAKIPPEFRAASELEAIRAAKQMYSIDGKLRAGSAEAVRGVLAESIPKVKDSKIDLERTYTNEFVR
ncbi:MAG TPA: ABC transporter substrate-binding protein, partial [Terriglobia bacterium]|nr:ABC transporter substrate-binding protein [Terriglobia bacterium]